MRTLLIFAAGYPISLAALVLLDWRTGWVIADAFGKTPPGGGEEN